MNTLLLSEAFWLPVTLAAIAGILGLLTMILKAVLTKITTIQKQTDGMFTAMTKAAKAEGVIEGMDIKNGLAKDVVAEVKADPEITITK